MTAIVELFVTVTLYVTLPPVSAIEAGLAVFATEIDGGTAVLVNVQTTTSPVATGTELLVPGVIGLLLLVQASSEL